MELRELAHRLGAKRKVDVERKSDIRCTLDVYDVCVDKALYRSVGESARGTTQRTT